MCFPCFSRTRALWRWIWPWPTHPRRRRPPRAALGPTRCEALRSTAKRLRGWMWSIYLIYVLYIHTYTYRERESRYAWGVGVWKCESLIYCIYIYISRYRYIHTYKYIYIYRYVYVCVYVYELSDGCILCLRIIIAILAQEGVRQSQRWSRRKG